MLATVAHHRADRPERVCAREAQLVVQVQVRSGEENVEARASRGLERLERGVNVLRLRPGERRDLARANLAGDGANRLQVAARCDREARFDHIHAELLELPRQAQLFRHVHREARRLLAVTQRRIEDPDSVHASAPYLETVQLNASGEPSQIYISCQCHKSELWMDRSETMELGQLEVFLAVARERSFSRAAEKLYRTQPAVSIVIRKLEEGVGQPLFVRGARDIKLTDAGALLHDYAERLLNLREEIGRGMRDLRGLRRGHLSLGVNESSIHALLPALARFRSEE